MQYNIFLNREIRLCSDKNKRIIYLFNLFNYYLFNFISLTNSSVTIGLSFLKLSISAIISSTTINIYRFLFGPYSSIFL